MRDDYSEQDVECAPKEKPLGKVTVIQLTTKTGDQMVHTIKHEDVAAFARFSFEKYFSNTLQYEAGFFQVDTWSGKPRRVSIDALIDIKVVEHGDPF